MVSHIHYNLNANSEDFVIFFTSKFITCFIDFHLHAFNLTSGLNFQSIAYLLRESEHNIEFWGLQGEVHSTWDLWTTDLQECNGDLFFGIGRDG